MQTVPASCFYCSPTREDRYRILKRECTLNIQTTPEYLKINDEILEKYENDEIFRTKILKISDTRDEEQLKNQAEYQYCYMSFVQKLRMRDYSACTNYVEFFMYQVGDLFLTVVEKVVPQQPELHLNLFAEALCHYTFETTNRFDGYFKHIGGGNIKLTKPDKYFKEAFFKKHVCTELCTAHNLLRHPSQPDYSLVHVVSYDTPSINSARQVAKVEIREIEEKQKERLRELEKQKQELLKLLAERDKKDDKNKEEAKKVQKQKQMCTNEFRQPAPQRYVLPGDWEHKHLMQTPNMVPIGHTAYDPTRAVAKEETLLDAFGNVAKGIAKSVVNLLDKV